jgi:hypothetical protein
MPLFGYGEDALTYHVLTNRLSEFLEELGDFTPSSDAIVFFRPSFGRRAAGQSGGRASPFGEFDAIVGTARAVYLIESKWSRSGEVWQPTLVIRPEQIRRHAVLRWYLERWRADRPSNWTEFATPEVNTAFEERFPSMKIPSATVPTVLADSLGYVLEMLLTSGPLIEDVLLYCDIDGKTCPPFPNLEAFRKVDITVAGAHRSGFFSLTAQSDTIGTPV